MTGTAAEKAKAAALKHLGGGTAADVTTDYSGSGYDVDATKNGTTTEVHLDSSFNVRGGPGGMHGGPSGPPQSGRVGHTGRRPQADAATDRNGAAPTGRPAFPTRSA